MSSTAAAHRPRADDGTRLGSRRSFVPHILNHISFSFTAIAIPIHVHYCLIMFNSRLAARSSRDFLLCSSYSFQSPLSKHRFRAFHATAPQRDVQVVLEAVLTVPHAMLQGMHSCGLTWAYAIPATALIVRCICVFVPFSLPARKTQQRYLALNPIRQAHQMQARKQFINQIRITGEYKTLGEGHAALALAEGKDLAALHRRWSCGLGRRLLPVLQFPVWLVMAETIRRMLGIESGLLGLAVKAFTTAPTDAIAIAESGAATPTLNGSFLEPSLATEGMLWFPNLMVPDPTLTLPFILSGVMLGNILIGSTPTKRVGRFQQRLRRLLIVVALAIGPLTLQLPAGLLLYWISSTSSAMLMNTILDIFWPLKAPPVACKRPLIIPKIGRVRH
jgi:mitochondrial inner membrane protein COX18